MTSNEHPSIIILSIFIKHSSSVLKKVMYYTVSVCVIREILIWFSDSQDIPDQLETDTYTVHTKTFLHLHHEVQVLLYSMSRISSRVNEFISSSMI